MVVTMLFTNYYSKYGKIWVFNPKNAPKMVKIAIFGQKKPVKLPFQPENDVYTRIPSVEVADTTVYRFSENFFRIARHFFEKSVIFGGLYLAI